MPPTRTSLDFESTVSNTDSPARSELVRSIEALARAELFRWADFPIELPHTVFADDAPLIAIEDLFRTVETDELEACARDENGALRSLTALQLSHVRARGEFEVPSVRIPGQSHVWRLTLLIARGYEVNRTRRRSFDNRAIRHLLINLPQAIVAEDSPSVLRALRRLRTGVTALVGLLVGHPTRVGVHSEHSIQARLTALRDQYVLAQCTRVSDTVWQVKTRAGAIVDVSFMFDDLAGRVETLLHEIESGAERDWHRERAAIRTAIVETSRETLSESAITTAMEKIRTERWLARLETHLTGLSPEGIHTLVALNIAAQCAQRVERTTGELREKRREELDSVVREASPLRSRVFEWHEAQVSARLSREDAHFVAEEHARLLASLQLQPRCAAQTELFAQALQWETTERPSHEKTLRDKEKPAREFDHPRVIWRRAAWKVVRLEATEILSSGITTETVSYRLERYVHHVVHTDQWFWRWKNMFLRGALFFNNGLHALWVSNFWLGPVGAKAMFAAEPFVWRWEVDQKTGVVEPVQRALRVTFRARLKNLWTDARRSRVRFEARPDTGFVGKSITRQISRVWNWGVKAGLGSVIVGLGQPVLWTLNLAFVLFATVFSFAWAWGGSVLSMLFSWLLVDLENPTRRNSRLPLLRIGLWDLGLAGVGQALFSLLRAGVWEPVCALGWSTLGWLGWGMRSVWDTTMFHALIRTKGRIPIHDGFLARRIAGPGLSREVYYQVPAELVLMVLHAALEQLELERYAQTTNTALNAPLDALERFTRELTESLVSDPRPAARLVKCATSGTEAPRKELEKRLAARRARLNRALDIPKAGQVRLNEDALDRVLVQGARRVELFCDSHDVMGATDPAREAFWHGRNLRLNDWEGLTRMLLAERFSAEMLRPLEQTDSVLALSVEHASVRAWMRALAEGTPPGDDLDRTRAQTPGVRVNPALDNTVMPARVRVPLEEGTLVAWCVPSCSTETLEHWRKGATIQRREHSE